MDVLASTSVKSHEAGILFTADSLARPVRFYEKAELDQTIAKYQLEASPFVKEPIGVGERGGRMALRKTKFEKVTVALLWEK